MIQKISQLVSACLAWNSLIKMNTNPNNHTLPFKCTISFKLFCSEKNPKAKEVNWIPLKAQSNISVSFFPKDNMTLDGFHKLVANKCDKNFRKIGRMILNGTKSEPPTITRSGYILKNKRFPKASPLLIFNTTHFFSTMDGRNWTMKRLDACQQGVSQQKQTALYDYGCDANLFDPLFRMDQIVIMTEFIRSILIPAILISLSFSPWAMLLSGPRIWLVCARVPGVSLVSPPAYIKFLTMRKESPMKAPTSIKNICPTTRGLHLLHPNTVAPQIQYKITLPSY
ncbi:hypothetical protein VP01_5407g1 [Puccinia sorghi]|uniref:Uncharacterized protein n=1 Tax=Puccinia sorghi TaxID=27349 RepID=A0A0L6UJT6_9BASI|nr:hypothetical protein VP01_5407g1 [Puccinia sorghi]